MRELARQIIEDAALAAGLPAGKLYDIVESDNLTIERPYMTIQFLPESLKRTGRKLGVRRQAYEQFRKRELYEIELEVAANILTEDDKWLADFCYAFLSNLPRGGNDARGNWVKVRAQRAEYYKPKDKRIGDDVIEVFTKRDQLFDLTFTGRITQEEREEMLKHFTIETYWRGQSYGTQHD